MGLGPELDRKCDLKFEDMPLGSRTSRDPPTTASQHREQHLVSLVTNGDGSTSTYSWTGSAWTSPARTYNYTLRVPNALPVVSLYSEWYRRPSAE